MVALKKACIIGVRNAVGSLSTESVQGTSLSLERINHVHSCHRLSLGMFGVGDCVSDNILKKYFQDTPGLLVDETANSFHSASASQSPDGWLGYTLDVVT